MAKTYNALSIVAPAGEYIAQGRKTLEIRSWLPEKLPLKNVVIVQNQHYLTQNGDEEMGVAVAMVDIESVHIWQKEEFDAACANYWETGYYAWVLSHVRPLKYPINVIAKRKIYTLQIDELHKYL